MSYAFGAIAHRSRSAVGFVTAESSERISVEDARAMFDEVLEALSMAGEDVSNIRFDEGYGYRKDWKIRSTNKFDLFEWRAYGRGGRIALGEFNPNTGEITIYRNAFSSRLISYEVSRGRIGIESLNAEAGFPSGLFVTAQEIGHRFHQHTHQSNVNEFQANRYAGDLYNRVCTESSRC